MKKLQFLSLTLAFLLVITIVAANLDIDPINLTGDPGETVIQTFEITNPGPGDVTEITFSMLTTLTHTNAGFTHDNVIPNANVVVNDLSSLTFLAGTNMDHTIQVIIPNQLYSGTYEGTMTAVDNFGSTLHFPIDVVVSSNPEMDVLEETYTLYGEEGESTNARDVAIRNVGTTDLSALIYQVTASNLDDEDGNVITIVYPSFSGVVLEVGETEHFDFQASIPDDMAVGDYYAEIKIQSGSAHDTFRLNIRVQPDFCDPDADQDMLDVSVSEPDNGDEFAPGEIIELEVDVDNNDDSDMDVIVEACLYDEDGKKVICVESEEQEIADDDSEEFNFDMELPEDDEDMNEGDYLLYVFAYEDGNDDEFCTVSSDVVDIEFVREDHDVIAESIDLVPSNTQPGGAVTVVVDLLNIGTKDEDDVYVIIKNPELDVDISSQRVDLQEFDDKDNDATARVSIEVPEDASNGEYDLEIIVYYDDEDESRSYWETLTVSGGAEDDDFVEEEESEEVGQDLETTPITGGVTFYPTSGINSWFGDGKQSTVFWIIGDIVLLIVAIYFLTLIFRKR